MFTDQEIQAFIDLWKDEFHEDIDKDHAIKEAGRLFALIKFATDPMPQVEGPGADKN